MAKLSLAYAGNRELDGVPIAVMALPAFSRYEMDGQAV